MKGDVMREIEKDALTQMIMHEYEKYPVMVIAKAVAQGTAELDADKTHQEAMDAAESVFTKFNQERAHVSISR